MSSEKKIVTITPEEFKEIREHLGETQTQFAERLGYTTYRTVWKKEHGEKKLMYRDEQLLRDYLLIIREAKAKTNLPKQG